MKRLFLPCLRRLCFFACARTSSGDHAGFRSASAHRRRPLRAEKFLRDWDPITIFFDADTGPRAGGPADAHEKFATITPERAGEWRWLGARALQFRPAEPWAPLQRVTVNRARRNPPFRASAHAKFHSAATAPNHSRTLADCAYLSLAVDAKALARC